VTPAEIERTLELVRDRKVRAIVTKTVPLEGVPGLHE
jgi:hypothetical protein